MTKNTTSQVHFLQRGLLLIFVLISACTTPKKSEIPIATPAAPAIPEAKEAAVVVNEEIVYSFDNRNKDTSKPLELNDKNGNKYYFPKANYDGMCGESYVDIPLVRLSKYYIYIQKDGKEIALKRPKYLHLDSMKLIDPKGKIIAEIEVPRQSIPVNIFSEQGAIVIPWDHEQVAITKDRHWTLSKSKMKTPTTEHLKDYKHPSTSKKPNAYLRYKKFPNGYIVEYSEPCT